MSSSTAIPLSAELKTTWERTRTSGDTRALIIAISNEECILEQTVKSTSSKESDFNSLMAIVRPNEARYILFRLETARWLLASFIPDNAKVSDKLVYAATTATLKRLLGDLHIADEVHFTTLAELSWSSYAAARAKVECKSEREQHIEKLDEMEAQARREQEEDAKAKSVTKSKSASPAASSTTTTTPAASKPARTPPTKPAASPAAAAPKPSAAPAAKPAAAAAAAATASPPATAAPPRVSPVGRKARPSSMEIPKHWQAEEPSSAAGSVSGLKKAFETGDTQGGSPPVARQSPSYLDEETAMKPDSLGGYHTVRMPVAPAATQALRSLASGSVNLVVLKIDNEQIMLVSSSSAQVSQLASHIDATEPRFLLYAYSRATAAAAPGASSVLFIYCCPDKSKPRTRMVYSTSKPWIVHEAQSAGVTIAKKMEIRSAEEASPQAINEALHPSVSYAAASRPAGSPTASRNLVSKPHPVYSQIAPDHAGSTLKKKIVLPPSGAW